MTDINTVVCSAKLMIKTKHFKKYKVSEAHIKSHFNQAYLGRNPNVWGKKINLVSKHNTLKGYMKSIRKISIRPMFGKIPSSLLV